MNEFGLKELYDVSLKTTYPMEINGRKFAVGETIAAFDKIQIANFQELKSIAAARGGHGNPGWVWWEDTKEIRINLIQGVFSKTQLALMTNAQFVSNEGEEIIEIPIREELETDEIGYITLKHPALADRLFIYNKEKGEPIVDYAVVNEYQIMVGPSFLEVVVDYIYPYTNGSSSIVVGRQFISGFLSLTGKTRIKDETTGQVQTGIIKIPKLKLMSDLSMRLGDNAGPIVGQLNAVAVPVGNRGQKVAMEVVFLNDDIDSDM